MSTGKKLAAQAVFAFFLVFFPSVIIAVDDGETYRAEQTEPMNTSEAGDSSATGGQEIEDENDKKDIRYVRDFIVITLRTGKGDEYKVVRTLKTDTPLEVLEEKDDFLRVKTRDGEEGWVRSRYIASDLPKPLIIESLRDDIKRLKQHIETLENAAAKMNDQMDQNLDQSQQEIATLRQQVKLRKDEAAAARKETAIVKKKYNKLLQRSSNVAELLNELEGVKKKNSLLQKDISTLTDTQQQLRSKNAELVHLRLLKWFLSGAGVLFAGFILGRMLKRKNYY